MSSRHRRTRSRSAPAEQFSQFNPTTEVHPEEAVLHRHARLEHVLTAELQFLLRDEVADPRLAGLQVLAVQLSADAGHARVAFALEGQLGREAELRRGATASLAGVTRFLRARLAQQLQLKRVPALSFTFVGVTEPGRQAVETDGASGGDLCPE